MPDSLPGGLLIREINENEADRLTALHEICFPHYLNRQIFTDFFDTPNTFACVVEKSGEPIAMMVYRITYEQAEIITIAVIPAFRGRGIAKKLLGITIEKCKQAGTEKLFLDVEEGNVAALKLYESFGFKQISRRKLYYQQLNGSLTDALVFEKKLG